MFRKSRGWWLAAVLMLAAMPVVHAQAEEETETPKATDTAGAPRFWQASLPGGSFMVALDKIISVSRQRYLLDGAFIVDEVTVDTEGQALARFYHIVPVAEGAASAGVGGLVARGRQAAGQAAGRTGVDLNTMVAKSYPTTSHAKSIEYRLVNAGDVGTLYNSVKTAWESGRGRQFSVK